MHGVQLHNWHVMVPTRPGSCTCHTAVYSRAYTAEPADNSRSTVYIRIYLAVPTHHPETSEPSPASSTPWRRSTTPLICLASGHSVTYGVSDTVSRPMTALKAPVAVVFSTPCRHSCCNSTHCIRSHYTHCLGPESGCRSLTAPVHSTACFSSRHVCKINAVVLVQRYSYTN